MPSHVCLVAAVLTQPLDTAPVVFYRSLPEVRIESKHLDDADTKTCSVCQEDFALGEMATLLPCGHLFHGKCIVQWLEKNRTCPLCRKEVCVHQSMLFILMCVLCWSAFVSVDVCIRSLSTLLRRSALEGVRQPWWEVMSF